MPMPRRILAVAVVLVASAPRGAGAAEGASAGEPRSFAPRAQERAEILDDVGPRCRASAERTLRGGAGDRSCARDTMRAGRRRLRHAPTRFGVVVHRKVDLVGARLVVAQASGCREWPTSSRGPILGEVDALAAGCRLRPYRGELALVVTDAGGRRAEVARVHADREGVVRFRFADVDLAVREHGLGTLDDWTAIDAGHDGWGGRFDLRRLRGFLADWHFSWVRRGRGSPALFALRHRDHPRSDLAVDLALDASLARQQRDFASVERGVLPPATFLDRYVWSPMRHSVESMLAELKRRTVHSSASPSASASSSTSDSSASESLRGGATSGGIAGRP
jgi:hypothetical protein